MMKKLLYTCGVIAMGLLSYGAFAQQTNNWYFGSTSCYPGVKMSFNGSSGPVVSPNDFPLKTLEGSSSISDASGNPLFYTDGVDIWNATTNVKFNTFSLGGGQSSTQSAIVMPKPGNANEWLVFTSSETGTSGTKYVTVRRTGSVFSVVEAAPITLTTGVGEGLYIIGSTKANSAYWVITRATGSGGSVRAFEITNTGVVNTTAVISTLSFTTATTQTAYTSAIGVIKSNSCQNKLAFTYLSGDVDITDFDAATGQVVASTAKRINVASTGGNSGSYGLEFSPNDAYLYITNLSGRTVYQYDITAGGTPRTVATLPSPNEAGQLALGPNGVIYMAISGTGGGSVAGTSYLGAIADPNSATSTLNQTAVDLSVSKDFAARSACSAWGLPTFPRSLVVSSLSANPEGAYCTNTIIPMSYVFGGALHATNPQVWDVKRANAITNATTPAEYVWTSPASNAQLNANPSIRFTAAGTYKVILTITDVCSRTYKDTLTYVISDKKIPAGTISCSGNTVTYTATGTPASDYPNYVWHDANGNVMGIGSPLSITYADPLLAPANAWVTVASSASAGTSGSSTVGNPTTTTTHGWVVGTTVSNDITVKSDALTITSFDLRARFGSCAASKFRVTIRNSGGTAVYTNNFDNSLAGAANKFTCVGEIFTLAINTNLSKGNYTITIDNASGDIGGWYVVNSPSGTSGGGSTAQIDYASVSLGNAIGQIRYNYKNFTITKTCSDSIRVNRLCSLPVEFVSFTAEKSGNNVQLNWVTAKEKDNSHFEVQRSLDGVNFSLLTTVTGAGNSNSLKYYNAQDKASSSTVYYRIKQVDYNGDSDYSSVRSVTGSDVVVSDINIRPNPNNGSFILDVTADRAKPIRAEIFNIIGSSVWVQTISSEGGSISIDVNLGGLDKGVYFLKIADTTQKIVIH